VRRQVKDLPRTGVASSELLNWYYTSAKVIPYGWNVDSTPELNACVMMDGINLRLAKQSDAAALAQLRYDFRASTGIATEPEGEFVERCSAWMTAHLDDRATGSVGWPSPKHSWALCGCNWLRKFPTRELSPNITLT
jgi:hypothetical protein